MIDKAEIVARIQQRADYQKSRISDSLRVMEESANAHHRYEDARTEINKREQIVKRISWIISPDDKTRIYVWEAIVEYLKAVSEARVYEINDFLLAIAFPGASYQSVQAAINNRPDIFAVKTERRSKLVSLKEGSKNENIIS